MKFFLPAVAAVLLLLLLLPPPAAGEWFHPETVDVYAETVSPEWSVRREKV